MRIVFERMHPYAWRTALQFFIKTVGTAAELFLPWLLSLILDEYAPSGAEDKIYLAGALMVGCAVLALLANVRANRMSARLSADITGTLRRDLFKKTMGLTCAKMDEYTKSTIVSRLSTDVYNVQQMLDRMQRLGVRAPILLLGGLAITFSIEPVLSLVILAVLPVLGAVITLISVKGIPLYTKTQKSLDTMVSRLREYASGMRVIKALSRESYEKERFNEANAAVAEREGRANLVMSAASPATNLFLNIGLAMVVLVGAFRVDAGFTKPGMIIAFLSYFTIMLNAVIMVSRIFVVFSRGAASAERIRELLNTPNEDLAKQCAGEKNSPFIEFRDVSFSYNKVKPDISGISFSVKKGGTLGIIGPTGSGKSTLARLLLGLYSPDSGEILIDGKCIHSIPEEELRPLFGAALQNDFIMADSIEQNVKFGRDISDVRVNAALALSQADFAEDRQDEAMASGGGSLSGGQRQRICIARALAGKPQILILDDSMSALDYKTEAALKQSLKAAFCGTSVIIAQRISSVMHADKIIVLEDGRMTGYGRHDELLESCADYRAIFEAQMGGAQ